MRTNPFPRRHTRVLVQHARGVQTGRVAGVTHNAPYQVTVALDDGTVDVFPLRDVERVGFALVGWCRRSAYTVMQDLGEGPTEGLVHFTRIFPAFKDAVLAVRSFVAEFQGDDPEGAKACFERYGFADPTDELEATGFAGTSGLREWEYTDGDNYLFKIQEVVLP